MKAADIRSLEARVAALECEVAQLRAANNASGNGAAAPVKDWRSTIGMFTDDPGMQEVFAEAMKLREADREKARRKWAREDHRKATRARARRRVKS